MIQYFLLLGLIGRFQISDGGFEDASLYESRPSFLWEDSCSRIVDACFFSDRLLVLYNEAPFSEYSGIFCYSLQKIPGILLFARGRTDLNFYIILIGGILNIILNIVLIRQHGLIGAAYATSITFALRLVISLLFYFHQLRQKAR